MKTLKLKGILFSLLTLFAVTMFITSCQQDTLTDDLTEMAEVSTSETELRGGFPDINAVVYYLNLLVGQIQTRNAGRPANIEGFYTSYADYLQDVLCLDLDIDWDEACPPSNGGEADCNLYLVGALQRLACTLQDFDAAPTCVNSINVQTRFFEYITTLEACTGFNLNENGYANALMFPGCNGYIYP